MTRKDYIRLAEAFSKHISSEDSTEEIAIWMDLRNNIADILADDNPNFDRDRFNAATETRPR